MRINEFAEAERACRLVAGAAQAEVLWRYDVTGPVSYRIERYLCQEVSDTLPATPCAIVGVQFSGKKVSANAPSADASQAVTSMPNVTLVIPGGKESAWEARGALDFAMIYFVGEPQRVLQRLLQGRHYPLALRDHLSASLVQQLAVQLQSIDRPDEQLQEYIAALSNALFHQVCLMLRSPGEYQVIDPAAARYPFIQNVLAHIQRHLDERLTIADLAEHAGLRQSHFREVFKRVTGCSPHRYINKLRMEKARHLLATTDLSILLIAEELGMSSQSHLTMAFKQYFDLTPAQYRKLAVSGAR